MPALNRKELTLLARVGALNQLGGIAHRRDALWQVERAGKPEGPLLRQRSEWLREDSEEDAAAEADDGGGTSGCGLCGNGARRWDDIQCTTGERS